MPVDEIAAFLGKQVLAAPEPALKLVLRPARWLRLAPSGPERKVFLKHRPVLDNRRLKEVFGCAPSRTSAEAFAGWKAARGHYRTGSS